MSNEDTPHGGSTLVADDGSDPRGLVRMPDGNLLVRDGARWRRVTPQGQVTTLPGKSAAPAHRGA